MCSFTYTKDIVIRLLAVSVYATSARPVNASSAHVSCMTDYSLFQAIIPSLLLVVANSDTAHDASKHLFDHLTLVGVHSCMYECRDHKDESTGVSKEGHPKGPARG